MSALEAAPELKDEVMSGRREERFYGTADTPNYFRKPYGKGWALVGDAGYHKDPVLAQGSAMSCEMQGCWRGLLLESCPGVKRGTAQWVATSLPGMQRF